MTRFTRRSFLLGLGLAFGCSAPPPLDPATVDTASPSILGVERLDSGSRFFAGTTARFRLRTDGTKPAQVAWSATAGSVESEGDDVVWALPESEKAWLIATTVAEDGQEQTAAFAFDIDKPGRELAFAVSMAAQGAVGDGYKCQLAIDANDRPHIAFLGDHFQLRYARFNGSTWDLQLVDGPGFDTGGVIANWIDLVLASNGTPHLAYQNDTDGQVWYATPSGNSWTRERVSSVTPSTPQRNLAIGLDPANGNRPVIFWPTGRTSAIVVGAYRASAGAWTESTFAGTADDFFVGGAVFDPTGIAYVTLTGGSARTLSVLKWSASSGFRDRETAKSEYYEWPSYVPIVLDGSNQPILADGARTSHRVGTSWIWSAYENQRAEKHDLAVTSGQPRVGLRHNGLEFLTLNSERYWLYQVVEPSIDDRSISVAVDRSGTTHACYVKSGQVHFR